MSTFLIRRIVHTGFVVLAVTIIVFGIIQLTPGDPILLMLGDQATPEMVDRLRSQMGFDRPLVVRYLSWLGGVLRGDFGTGLRDGLPVLPALMSRLPATLVLLVSSMLLAAAIGIPLGVISAIRRNSLVDAVSRIVALLGISMPSFWTGVMLIYFFGYMLRWFPISGYGSLAHVVLPSLALGLTSAALVARLCRSAMLDVMRKDYVRTARAKGLAESVVIFRHAMRNALIPVVTVIGLQAGYLLGGSVAVETVFAWPGMGLFSYQRLMQRDYSMIMGSLFLYSLLFALVNLLTDLLYVWIDPRIRYE